MTPAPPRGRYLVSDRARPAAHGRLEYDERRSTRSTRSPARARAAQEMRNGRSVRIKSPSTVASRAAERRPRDRTPIARFVFLSARRRRLLKFLKTLRRAAPAPPACSYCFGFTDGSGQAIDKRVSTTRAPRAGAA
ncbi:hypothetical protein EVAR_24158_1 [Eumeta japonica]|uniref:Uncharacterized protein n=1 Tax=Eumeta variegata TaxID=151549 RepID=A0A4C1W750_EUMVA|nr:hypothetical protein EVAR_24158_1 [Eumeta japonica]